MSCRSLLPPARAWAAIVALGLAAISPLLAQTGPDDSWDGYRILVDRNMFLRDRRPPRPRGPSSGPARYVPRDTDRDIVLTGVARHDGEFVAFFENTATGAITRARVGQAVGKGRARGITLDAVEYERDGAVAPVRIGDALRGGRFVRETVAPRPPAATSPSQPSLATTAPTTGPSEPLGEAGPSEAPGEAGPTGPEGSTPSSDMAEILRRMRQRREQELGK